MNGYIVCYDEESTIPSIGQEIRFIASDFQLSSSGTTFTVTMSKELSQLYAGYRISLQSCTDYRTLKIGGHTVNKHRKCLYHWTVVANTTTYSVNYLTDTHCKHLRIHDLISRSVVGIVRPVWVRCVASLMDGEDNEAHSTRIRLSNEDTIYIS